LTTFGDFGCMAQRWIGLAIEPDSYTFSGMYLGGAGVMVGFRNSDLLPASAAALRGFPTVKTHALVASFSQPAQAAQAVQALCRSEFRAGDIYVNNTPRGKSPRDTNDCEFYLELPESTLLFTPPPGR